jgi:hypothetical protein
MNPDMSHIMCGCQGHGLQFTNMRHRTIVTVVAKAIREGIDECVKKIWTELSKEEGGLRRPDLKGKGAVRRIFNMTEITSPSVIGIFVTSPLPPESSLTGRKEPESSLIGRSKSGLNTRTTLPRCQANPEGVGTCSLSDKIRSKNEAGVFVPSKRRKQGRAYPRSRWPDAFITFAYHAGS